VGSLWTPSGEYQPQGGGDPSPPPGAPPPAPPGAGDDDGPSAEEIAALRDLHARLSSTPVEDVVANHVFGLWQLALVYLGVATPPDEQGRQPMPNLPSAGLVIDAVAALLDGVGPRLGEHEQSLRDALTQTQMIYVQLAEALAQQPGGGGQAG